MSTMKDNFHLEIQHNNQTEAEDMRSAQTYNLFNLLNRLRSGIGPDILLFPSKLLITKEELLVNMG